VSRRKVKAVIKFVLTEILKPATHRLGSALGVYLASMSAFSEAELVTLENASLIVMGFVVDLLVRKAI
jgi:hypothetical protein